MHHDYMPPPKPRSFFSTVALGIAVTAVTAIICGTSLVGYGLHTMSGKSSDLIAFVQQTIRDLPEIQRSLPPVLADAINDRRAPDYARELDINASIVDRDDDAPQTVITVKNRGDQVVSLLSMHVVVTNHRGDVISESNEWAATPLAGDRDWRGPLMPGAERTLAVNGFSRYRWNDRRRRSEPAPAGAKVTCEVTDVRVWSGDRPNPYPPASTVPAEAADSNL